MKSQQSPLGTSRLNRQMDIGKDIPLRLAVTVMVGGFLRDEVGYWLLTYPSLFSTAFGLLMLTWLANFPLITWIFGNWIVMGDTSLRFFALWFLAVGLWQRHQRKQEKWDPNRPHGSSLGVTRFGFLPLREDYIYRFVDPGVALLIGALLRELGFALLGLYWMVAAVALFIVEFKLHQQTELNDWGLGDRPKEAERDADVFKTMRGPGEAKHSSQSEPGIPTGCDGLADEIEKRRRERSGDAADPGGGK